MPTLLRYTDDSDTSWQVVRLVYIDEDGILWVTGDSPWADAVAAGYCGA